MQTCSTTGCHSPTKARGLCKRHYDTFLKASKRGGHLKPGDFCRQGHKIEGDNAQYYLNHGIERVRCAQCNRVKPNIKIKIGDVCIYGHKIEGENAYWIASPDGSKRLRCRQCANERRARYIEANKETKEFQERLKANRATSKERKQQGARADSYDKILTVQAGKTNGSYGGLRYLNLNRRAQVAWESLEQKFAEVRSFCYESPAEYIDYDEENPPSKEHAFNLCNGCPMLVECARLASAYKPPIGVWGGEVWEDGKVMYK
jgi:hypothetical protein